MLIQGYKWKQSDGEALCIRQVILQSAEPVKRGNPSLNLCHVM